MAKAENIAVAIGLVGSVFIGAGILIGERAPNLTIILWVLGVPIAAVGFGLLFVVGAASLGRRALRAAGILPTPLEPAVPQPGWPGWRFTVEGVEHDVWVDAAGMTSRIVCDGRWAEATRSGRTIAFMVGQWPATVTERVDWGTTGAMLPLVVGIGLLGGDSGAEPLPMRYDLAIGGTPVPDSGRLVYDRGTAHPARTRAQAGDASELDQGMVTPGGPQAPVARPLRANPPPR